MYTVHNVMSCCCFFPRSEELEMVNSPTVAVQQVLPHPFVKLLQDLWPFGEDFKDLGTGGKIYEIIKVQNVHCKCTCVRTCAHYVLTFAYRTNLIF